MPPSPPLFHKPWMQPKSCFFSEYATNQQKAEAIKKVTLQDLVDYMDNLYKQYYIEGLFSGDLTEEQAKAAYAVLREQLQGKPWPKAEQKKLQVVSLPQKDQPHALQTNVQQPNDALILMIQDGEFSFTSSVAMQVLGKHSRPPSMKPSAHNNKPPMLFLVGNKRSRDSCSSFSHSSQATIALGHC